MRHSFYSCTLLYEKRVLGAGRQQPLIALDPLRVLTFFQKATKVRLLHAVHLLQTQE